MREHAHLSAALRSRTSALVITSLLAGLAVVIAWSASSSLDEAVLGLPVVHAVSLVMAVLAAWLLYERAAVEEDDRLRWFGFAYGLAAAIMVLYVVSFPTVHGGGPLRTSASESVALYLLWHLVLGGCVLMAMSRTPPGWRTKAAFATVCLGLGVYILVGAGTVPPMLGADGRYSALCVGLHLAVLAVLASATYVLWHGRANTAIWASPLLTASLGFGTADMLLHALAGSRFSVLWWASLGMRFAQFAVLAIGLLVAMLALTRTLERFADDLLQRLGGQEPGGVLSAAGARPKPENGQRSLDSIVDLREVDPVFQPVIDLQTGRTVGFEALARFPSRPGVSPAVVFAEAARAGLGGPLEMIMIERALEFLDDFPDDVWMALNLSPSTVGSSRLLSTLAGAGASRVVLEITEHVPIAEYDALTTALRKLKACGVRVAVDDTGAGFASFRHVVRLRPDIIKLDMSLTTGIDEDPVRRALASSIISFADSVDSTVVAEGIETPGELEALTGLGVPLGQGFLWGRPGVLPPPGLLPLQRTASVD